MRALIVSVVLMVAAILPQHSHAQLEIDITQGVAEPMPVAIPVFLGGDAIAAEFTDVVGNNLQSSGLFRLVNRAAYLQQFSNINELPRFPDWKAVNTQLLIVGQVSPTGNTLRVDFRLFDVIAGQQMTGFTFQSTRENWRRLAHMVSDAIYTRVTGEQGYFDTRVVYIAESGSALRPVKRLAVMDRDGANHRYLTNGSDLVLTPRFAPKAPIITYLSYRGGKPHVYLHHIDTNRTEVLGDFPGMTFAPRFSPDGSKIIFSQATSGNSDVFTLDINSKRLTRLTQHPAIDTSADYAPDGRQIVFNSDRGGSQQLYVMNADGSGARRISYGDGRYATPVWSPRGDLVAFTKSYQGQFYIGVMRPDGRGERLLTSAYMVESPTWAPNGRVLMFFEETRPQSNGQKSSKLYSIDITGRNKRQIPTPGNASDPAWSALNPQ